MWKMYLENRDVRIVDTNRRDEPQNIWLLIVDYKTYRDQEYRASF